MRFSGSWGTIFALLLVLAIVFFNLSLLLGSVNLHFSAIYNFLFLGTSGNESWDLILGNFRLPKAITAISAGAALGVSGLQMQTLFRNPLAGPFILGISSGASLGVAITIFLGFHLGGFVELSGISRSWLMAFSAGLGAFLVLVVIALAANRVRDVISLLIIGLMFGAAAGAVVSILQFFSKAENIQAYVVWTFGSLGSLSWEELKIFMPVIFLSLVGSLLLSKPLNTLLLGEEYAQTLGVNIKRTRLLVIINTSLLAGTVTAFCGPIAFIGIAMPHIVRMLFQTTNHLLLTPLVILMGGIALLLFDMVSQLPGLEATLPLNAITSILGAPFVVYLMLRKKTLNRNFK